MNVETRKIVNNLDQIIEMLVNLRYVTINPTNEAIKKASEKINITEKERIVITEYVKKLKRVRQTDYIDYISFCRESSLDFQVAKGATLSLLKKRVFELKGKKSPWNPINKGKNYEKALETIKLQKAKIFEDYK